MNVIDCYYKFEKLNPKKSKSRFELVYNLEIYEPVNNQNPRSAIK